MELIDIPPFTLVMASLSIPNVGSCFKISKLINYGKKLKFEEKLDLRIYCLTKICRYLNEKTNAEIFTYYNFLSSKNHPNFNN